MYIAYIFLYLFVTFLLRQNYENGDEIHTELKFKQNIIFFRLVISFFHYITNE